MKECAFSRTKYDGPNKAIFLYCGDNVIYKFNLWRHYQPFSATVVFTYSESGMLSLSFMKYFFADSLSPAR